MLRRNSADTFLEISLTGHLPDQIPSCKILQLSIRRELRRSHLLDPLLLIPHFHSARETTLHLDHCAPRRSPFLLLHESFQWTHFYSFFLPGNQRKLLKLLFFARGPSFPHPFSRRDTHWCRFFLYACAARSVT